MTLHSPEFVVGEYYTNDDIRRLGGDPQLFLLRSGERVVAGRFNERMNHALPNTLIVGTSAIRIKAAMLFRSQTEFIPVFLKPRKLNRSRPWRFEGRFRVKNRIPDAAQDAEEIRLAKAKWPQYESISLVLHLERQTSTLAESTEMIARENPDLYFTPEFAGSKRYELSVGISSDSVHGRVINGLHAALSVMGKRAFNTKLIDLFVVNDSGLVTHMFEAKTDQNTTSLYSAVGQVLLHSALESAPQRILVLPGDLQSETKDRLRRIGIDVLRYRWQGDLPMFENLSMVI
jgi:hypothetical protein